MAPAFAHNGLWLLLGRLGKDCLEVALAKYHGDEADCSLDVMDDVHGDGWRIVEGARIRKAFKFNCAEFAQNIVCCVIGAFVAQPEMGLLSYFFALEGRTHITADQRKIRKHYGSGSRLAGSYSDSHAAKESETATESAAMDLARGIGIDEYLQQASALVKPTGHHVPEHVAALRQVFFARDIII